jgi:hypothetical protein
MEDDNLIFRWHMVVCPITRQKPSTIYMRGNALQLFKQFFHYGVIFMITHSLWL